MQAPNKLSLDYAVIKDLQQIFMKKQWQKYSQYIRRLVIFYCVSFPTIPSSQVPAISTCQWTTDSSSSTISSTHALHTMLLITSFFEDAYAQCHIHAWCVECNVTLMVSDQCRASLFVPLKMKQLQCDSYFMGSYMWCIRTHFCLFITSQHVLPFISLHPIIDMSWSVKPKIRQAFHIKNLVERLDKCRYKLYPRLSTYTHWAKRLSGYFCKYNSITSLSFWISLQGIITQCRLPILSILWGSSPSLSCCEGRYKKLVDFQVVKNG